MPLMQKTLALGAFLAVLAAPAAALADELSSSLVPDGTYTVKVERVDDAQHITVRMDNGIETTLPAKGAVNFTAVKANDTVMVSIIGGKVPVFKVK